MFEDLIFQKLWIILPIWLLLYLSDYYLTILGAYYYKTGGCEHIVFEGSYELTPQFQSDIDALRIFSPRFIFAVLTSSAIIVFFWYNLSECQEILPFFQFFCGGFILQEVAVVFRNFQTITQFRFANKHQGISGQVRYERWLSYRLSAVELLCFAAVFLIVYLFTGSVSFLGGSILTASTGLRHLKRSKRKTVKDCIGDVVQKKE
jgi:hypothetical protein